MYHVVVTRGLDAGRRCAFVAGAVLVGRGPACDLCIDDPSVSRRHLSVVETAGGFEARDLGSRNGTWTSSGERIVVAPIGVGAPVHVGDSAIEVRVGVPAAPVAADPAPPPAPWSRPPRPAPLLPPAAVIVPAAAPPAEGPPPPAVTTLLAPLLVAGAMAAVTRSPLFLLMALASPLVAVAGWLGGRRRVARSARRAEHHFREDVCRFEAELAAAASTELARRTAAHPDAADVTAWAVAGTSRLWERRVTDADHLRLNLGVGRVPWTPPLDPGPGSGLHSPPVAVAAAVEVASFLASAPVVVDLTGGGVVGIVGNRPAARALARMVAVQAATVCGPADLTLLIATPGDAAAGWAWASQLPHARPLGGLVAPLAAAGVDASVLAVFDDDDLLATGEVRRFLDRCETPAAAIVVAGAVELLPASCRYVVTVDATGDAVLDDRSGAPVQRFVAYGVAAAVAGAAAAGMARWYDPEAPAASTLPVRVGLLETLGLVPCTADAVVERWEAAAATSGAVPRGAAPVLRAVLGAAASGPFAIDLVADGPHALAAGTTGAGKSELLRTLVASLALTASPEEVTFLLVDFKGGSAFDACARLPHVVGLVTDLDEHLAARALRCLDAELRRREQALRDAGAPDVAGYGVLRCERHLEAMPRLVVVIDEFATLRAELPGFVDALVDVAQRGRSLGVHLVLATQRPHGAVSATIRANTNLRIALRVQDAEDSTDVVGVAAAATLPRGVPGRGLARLGPGELTCFQAATATADLAAIVAATGGACERLRSAPPRRPWTEPLPADVDLAALPADSPYTAGPTGADETGGVCRFALADDPAHQSQPRVGWAPADGNLLVIGAPGAGVSTALTSITLALAARSGPADTHLYVVDGGAAHLAPLGALPHVGAFVGAGDDERLGRLVRQLLEELDRRRAVPPAGNDDRPPGIVVLVDGAGAVLGAAAERGDHHVADGIGRILTEGPAVGIRTVVGADRIGAVPHAAVATIGQRLLLSRGQRSDGAGAATARAVPVPPGRGRLEPLGLEVQVARAGAGVAAEVGRIAGAWSAPPDARAPRPVALLCCDFGPSLLGPPGRAGADAWPWRLPVGLAEHDLEPASLTVHLGDHLVVAGPPRSGRTAALALLGHAVRDATPSGEAGTRGPGVEVVAVAPPRSPLACLVPWATTLELGVPAALDVVDRAGVPVLVLVDDADRLDDPHGHLDTLLEPAGWDRPVVVAAASRTDTLRGAYGGFLRQARRSRLGVLLRPDPDLDGDLLGVRLPRRSPVPWVPGRGYVVVDGEATLVQLAHLDCP